MGCGWKSGFRYRAVIWRGRVTFHIEAERFCGARLMPETGAGGWCRRLVPDVVASLNGVCLLDRKGWTIVVLYLYV